MKIKYNLKDKFDFTLFGVVLILCVFGLVAIYSATYNHPTAHGNFEKQLTWLIFSLFIFLITYFLPPKFFKLLALPGYLLALFALTVVVFTGRKIYGAQSWLMIGPIGFQPSEFSKLAVILMLAYWLSRRGLRINSLKDIAIALAIGIVPVLLIMMQPDLGTAIVFGAITLVMVFWAGIDLFGLFVVLSPGIVVFASLFGLPAFVLALLVVLLGLIYFKRNLFTSASVFILNIAAGFSFDYFFRLLRPHQQMRIKTFINPSADPLGYGYNALQAKVAIGSGGLLGKGLLHGNQTQLRFIPEQWTDFIYCVIGEELGFIGAIIVVALFFVLFYRLLLLASTSKDKFNSLVIVGILTTFFVHFVINVGMNIGISPVIGIPLPFVSYGGSSLLVNMIAIGITLSIFRTRKERV